MSNYVKVSHTVAILTVSIGTYQEISDKLTAAGYHHAFIGDGLIDLSGIAVSMEELSDESSTDSCVSCKSV